MRRLEKRLIRLSREYEAFDDAMSRILRADPAKVKAQVDAGIREHSAERKAKGEHKRGRKPKASASGRASRSEH